MAQTGEQAAGGDARNSECARSSEDARKREYARKIDAEGRFWDREFVEAPDEPRYHSFFHHNRWCHRRLTTPILRRIFRHLGPGTRVFDLGCGQGWLGLLMAEVGAEVTGGDVARGCVAEANRVARERGLAGCRFVHYDANTDALPGGEYEMVVAWGALHHVQDLEHCLGEVRRGLQPGGRLALVECVDVVGWRGRLAAGLADVCHLLLPTDRSYGEKLRFAWGKLTRREAAEEFAWSPFEMAGGAKWLQIVERDFATQHREALMGFTAPFVARLRIGGKAGELVTAALLGLDRLLVWIGLLEPEYHFMIVTPRESGNED